MKRAVSLIGFLSALFLLDGIACSQSVPILQPQQTLFPTSTDVQLSRDDNFGRIMDMDGNTLVVGMQEGKPGAVAVYTRNASGGWTRTATLLPRNSGVTQFGSGVAIDGDWVMVTSGVRDLNVFQRVNRVWRRGQRLSLTSQESITGHLDLRGDIAVVSAVEFITAPLGRSETIVLRRNEQGLFVRRATLKPGDRSTTDSLHHRVLLNEASSTLLIGVPNEAEAQGAVFVYQLIDGRWVQHQKLTAMNARPGEEFGFSLAMNGNQLAVGAPQAVRENALGNGTAYAFVRSGRFWFEQYELRPTPQQWSSYLGALGHSVAILDNAIIVAAPFAVGRFTGAPLFFFERGAPMPNLKAQAQGTLHMGEDLAAERTTLFAGVPQATSGRVLRYEIQNLPLYTGW